MQMIGGLFDQWLNPYVCMRFLLFGSVWVEVLGTKAQSRALLSKLVRMSINPCPLWVGRFAEPVERTSL